MLHLMAVPTMSEQGVARPVADRNIERLPLASWAGLGKMLPLLIVQVGIGRCHGRISCSLRIAFCA